jgi:glycosyltransferase involved in cell wall biosynthesis
MCALVLEPSGGPSLPRNTGASIARAPLLAFLDDDCLPEPGWLAALLSAAAGREAVIQGRTVPDGDRPPTAWARAIRVEGPSVLYESCNIAYRRTVFVELGGFPLLDLLPGLPAARGFGEDVLLGCRAAASYGASFAGTAVVRHRWLPGDYRDHLAARRRLVGFAELARRCPEVRAALTSGVFLSRHTARFDLAVAAALAAAAGPWWLAAGAVPYLRAALAEARWRGGPLPLRVTQLAIADAVGLASLLRGSASARMPVF